MFQRACEVAQCYTFPYVGLRSRSDGQVLSTVGAFVVVNPGGWAVTAKHIFEDIGRAEQSIASGAGEEASLTNHVEIWATGLQSETAPARVVEVKTHKYADVVAFRLDPFDLPPTARFPSLRTGPITPGLSVCRIGYPWNAVQGEFRESAWSVSGFPVPMFAIEGIVSRLMVETHPDGGSARYIQTSNPGLRGQSGGPLFDIDGRLCGLQSSTIHLDLDFDARYERDGDTIVERQFLNVGQAVHVDEVRRLLDENGIDYRTA